MIDPLPALSSPVANGSTASTVKAAASAARTSFGQTLAAFVDSRAAASDPAAATAPDDDRHDAAADGNSLPSDTDPGDGAAPSENTLLIPLPLPPVPISTAAAATPADDPPIIGGTSSSPVARSGSPSVTGESSPPRPAADPVTAGASLRTNAAVASGQPSTLLSDAHGASSPPLPPTPAARGAAQPAVPLVPPPIDPSIAAALDGALTRASVARQDPTAPTRPLDGTQPIPLASSDPASTAIVASAVPQPAGRVFAAALATAWRDRSQRADDADASAIPLGIVAPTLASGHAVVAASGDASQSGLDLTHDTGLQRMIEHIETLRDDADAHDTRIRLVPDSLGGVDVAVRQVGDRVHVHFTAEQEATRALLADAQPRLTELAAARGVRIGDTSVSADSGSGNGAAPQPRPVPSAPAQAPRTAIAETEIPTDARVA